ncbi:hypothetical protein GUJ93_ZPchr0003g17182 [Zizania palustris]|uniref:Uncharacterized protein n=1 Tax=Zizania palustris TaxID=103762 RepID=A0A8J5SA39_ZIZPA|nr:hypothetical protein GUJ93_ZPchr0003g17182 [Zizania palustris]
MSPVRRARATAVAAIRHDDTHAARTAHTLSTTDTAIAQGIDIPPPPPLLLPLLSWPRTPAIQRVPSVHGPATRIPVVVSATRSARLA